MNPKKFRWSKVYESSEEELLQLLEARNFLHEHWKAGEFEDLAKKTAENPMTLWCAEGSFIITVDGTTTSMQPGDALDIPKGATYEIRAGISGCICYETTLK